VFYFEIRVRHE